MRVNLKDWCIENSKEDLLEQWDYEKNSDIDPQAIAPGSDKIVWWICEVGHSYDMQIKKRTLRGNRCPVCSGHRILAGFNDLATTHPDLAAEWDFEKNEYPPTNVSKGSNQKVYWRCKKGHGWLAQINSRAGRTQGCPYCSGKIAIVGKTDLATTSPQLCSEWDYEKNRGLSPTEVLAQSNKAVWWRCSSCGNEWKTAISHRTNGSGCPKCSAATRGAKKSTAETGKDDLETLYPQIAKEWHPTKNGLLRPDTIKSGSGKKVWWQCEKGHEWTTAISARTGEKHGSCPICSGRQVLSGYNDLATTHPHLLEEWDYAKNIDLQPTNVTKGSDKKVFWLCKKGHSWKAAVSSRIAGNGCPHCAKELRVSFPEKAIAYYLREAGFEVEESYRPEWLGKSELDIYLPALRLGIEYDGEAWHKSGKKDLKKDLRCLANGVRLIRIREPKCPHIQGIGPCYNLPDTKESSLAAAIEFIFQMLRDEYSVNIPPEIHVDIASNRIKIYELMELRNKENSLAILQPQLAREWNHLKNGSLTPDMIYERANKKVWWLCPTCGHEWDAVVASRVAGNGCPKCGKIKAAHSQSTPMQTDSLQAANPELCKEWDYEENGTTLTPSDVFPFSHRKVWWKCSKGHHWKATVADRSSGKVCPYCSGVYPIPGETDLATLFPDIANEWHPDKNEDLKPREILPSSSRKVWWQCKYGHEWLATISNRTGKNRTGCPICSGKKVLTGFNDLATTHQTLAQEWHTEKNKPLTPKDVTVGSNKKVWWRCHLGHEWEAIINSRRNGSGCPVCANRVLLKGFNDLATTYPDIAAQWHPLRNGELSASAVFAGTAQKVWWQCEQGHEWFASVNGRTANKTGCPICFQEKRVKKVVE